MKKAPEWKLVGFRNENDNLFGASGLLSYKKLNHSPCVVIAGDTIVVEPELRKVLQFDDDCDVIFQWRGQWRSDFFHFKIRDLKAYIESHPDIKERVAKWL